MCWVTILAIFCWRILLFNVEAVTLIDGPENAVVPYGSNHTLNCRLNETSQCFWYKDNIPVRMSHRYRYITNDSANSSAYCSLGITSFQMIDAGVWQCKPNGSLVGEASLYVAPVILLDNIPIDHDSLSVFADGTQTGELTCKTEDVNSTDPLSWMVDGRPVNSGNVSGVCNDAFCTYNLSWTGDWSSLVNASNISCIAKDGATTTFLTTLGFGSKEFPDAPAMSLTNILMIIAAGAAGLVIVLFCLVACLWAKVSGEKQPGEKPEVVELIPTVSYFGSDMCLNDFAVNSNSWSRHSLPDDSLVNGGYCGSEKQEELMIKPEFGNASNGAVMIHYSNSVNIKRTPIDSLYVNRWSTPQQPKKSQSLGCKAVRSRMPLPFGTLSPAAIVTDGTVGGTYSIVRDPRDPIPKAKPTLKPSPNDPHLYYDPPP